MAYLFFLNKALAFVRNRIENPTHSFLAICLFCGSGGIDITLLLGLHWAFSRSWITVGRMRFAMMSHQRSRAQSWSSAASHCDSVRVPPVQGFPNHYSCFCLCVGLEQVLICPQQNSTCFSVERKTPLFLATPGSCCTLHTQGKFTRKEHTCYNM